MSAPGSGFVKHISQELRRALAGYAAQNLPTPFQLPKQLATFTGRESVLKSLARDLPRIIRTEQVVAIAGMGGVGKSALASQFAHLHRRRFIDGVLWADLRAQSTASVLDSIALAYGVKLTSFRDLYAKAEAVRTLLAGKRAMLILDNAEQCSDLELILPSGKHTLTLVTTRDQDMHALRGAYSILLHGFNEDEALAHIGDVIGPPTTKADLAAARRLAEECGYLPLALDIAVTLAKRSHITVTALVHLIAHNRQKLQILQERERSLAACFQLSISNLKNREKGLFLACSIFGGSSFSHDALAYITGLDADNLRLIMGELVAVSLLGVRESGRYYLHPLLKEYAANELSAAHLDESTNARQRLVQFYLDILSSEIVDDGLGVTDYGAIRVELDNILGIYSWCTQTGRHASVSSFAKGLEGFLFRQGYWNECRAVLEAGAKASMALADWRSYYAARLRQGELAVEMGSYSEADSKLTECLHYYRREGPRRLQAQTMREMAELRRAQREYAQAKAMHLECLELRRGDNDQYGIAQSLHDVGVIERILGNHGAAESRLRQSLEISVSSRNADQEAYTLLELGMIARKEGHGRDAWNILQNSLTKFTSLGDKRGEAYSVRELGEVCISEARYQAALQYHVRSLELRIQLGDRRGQALARHRLGHAHQCLSHPKKARRLFDASMTLAESLGDRLCIGLNHIRLGELDANGGDLAGACRHWHLGLTLLDALGVDTPEQAAARKHLAELDGDTDGLDK